MTRILREIDVPASKVAELCLDPERAVRGLAGQARARALRTYVLVGEALRRWPPRTQGITWLQGPGRVLDYRHPQWSEPCGPAVPESVAKGLAWLAKLADGTGARLSDERGGSKEEADVTATGLSHGRESRRPAPRFPSAIIVAMERFVVDRGKPDYLRGVAWLRLVKIWAALRHDEYNWLTPELLTMVGGRPPRHRDLDRDERDERRGAWAPTGDLQWMLRGPPRLAAGGL